MSNPAYLWLTDENGSPISGSCLVRGREESIELKSLTHHMAIPTDRNTGKLTGTRIHTPILIQKDFDRVTPLLYRAISQGLTLKSAEIKMYLITDAGIEMEYFNIFMEHVKITGITPNLHLDQVLARILRISRCAMSPFNGSMSMVILYIKTHGMSALRLSVRCWKR